jgi:hypothetical protein
LIILIEKMPEEKQQALLRLAETFSEEAPAGEQEVILNLLSKLEAEGEVVLPQGGVFQARSKPRAVPIRGVPASQMIIEERQ